MTDVFISLLLIAIIGSSLKFFFKDIDLELFRKNINKIVLNIILPALIFNVVVNSDLNTEFYQIPVVAASGILSSLILAILIFGFSNLPPNAKGSLILGSAFSNVTYLGLPFLQGMFPEISEKISIVSILFEVTTTPLLLSLGILIALYYGTDTKTDTKSIFIRIIKLPPLWALIIAYILNLFNIPLPNFILFASKTLGVTASGLMILSLGIALKYRRPRYLKHLLIVAILQLLFIPFIAYFTAKLIGLQEPYYDASIMLAAMPTQMLTLVIADEFGLDVELLAIIIFYTTILSFFTLFLLQFLI